MKAAKRSGAIRTLVRSAALAVLAALARPAAGWACATCFGDPEAPETRALNLAILFLVGVVGLVQAGIVKVIWDFHQRSKKLGGDPTELRLIRGGKR